MRFDRASSIEIDVVLSESESIQVHHITHSIHIPNSI